jgi:hypothetical protein
MDMGLDERRFRRMTPAQYILMSDHLRRKRRSDLYGHAMICSILSNINRDRKKRRRPFGPEDFLPPDVDAQKSDPSDGAQSPEQMLAICQFLFGGTKKQIEQASAPESAQ